MFVTAFCKPLVSKTRVSKVQVSHQPTPAHIVLHRPVLLKARVLTLHCVVIAADTWTLLQSSWHEDLCRYTRSKVINSLSQVFTGSKRGKVAQL